MKRTVYITAWIILGLVLSFIGHALIEMSYINYALGHGITPVNHTAFGLGYCALPIWLQSLLIVLGITGGITAGNYFWRIIYVEKRRRFKHF